jgi:ribokinase
MKVINFGSLNLDHSYEVDHLVRPGETITAAKYELRCGGKGLNQSIALARAGVPVFHAGKVGRDGEPLIACLTSAGVDVTWVQTEADQPSGHAMIQVDRQGQNSIVVHGGANREVRVGDAERVFAHFGPGDCLLLQNEISAIPEIIKCAKQCGLMIYLNPAPMDAAVSSYPLELVDGFFINHIEGSQMTGETEASAIVTELLRRFPASAAILTLGANGVLYGDRAGQVFVPAEKVQAVDTTAAGDAFIGYFLAERIKGQPVRHCLEMASRAAAICVTRRGAADSIPFRDEVISPNTAA